METNNTAKGFWMMIEEPIEETLETQSTQENNFPNTDTETFKDSYDFYPDSGF
ncbi:hypothetical protein [Flavobacterium sp.]|uniref:hypothetical protein n=1 Tax=Flavobacterium sp. TaxID=239 RepID=UPI0039E2A72D